VLLRHGFALEGRLRDAAFKEGRLADTLVYGLTRRDWEAGGAAAGKEAEGAAAAAAAGAAS
jgi:hypothetical protein